MTTIILAKIFGLYFIALGLAFILNPDHFKGMYQQVRKDENFLLIGGVFALLIGIVIISIHNIWIFNWSVILTILGWWSLIKGFALLAYPGTIKYFSFIDNRSRVFYRLTGLVYTVFGLFLSYKGWTGNLYF